MITGYDEQGEPIRDFVIPVRPLDLNIVSTEGQSRMVPSKISEKWRLRLTNGKVPDAWFNCKWIAMYTIPMFAAREESEVGG